MSDLLFTTSCVFVQGPPQKVFQSPPPPPQPPPHIQLLYIQQVRSKGLYCPCLTQCLFHTTQPLCLHECTPHTRFRLWGSMVECFGLIACIPTSPFPVKDVHTQSLEQLLERLMLCIHLHRLMLCIHLHRCQETTVLLWEVLRIHPPSGAVIASCTSVDTSQSHTRLGSD